MKKQGDKMESFQKEIQRSLLKYGSLKEIIKKNDILTIIDSAIQTFLDLASKRLYRPNGTNYGLPEALFRSKRIDQFDRYACIINKIYAVGWMRDVVAQNTL